MLSSVENVIWSAQYVFSSAENVFTSAEYM